MFRKKRESEPIVRLCNAMLVNALTKSATLFSVVRSGEDVNVLFHIDGEEHLEMTIPSRHQQAVVDRFKEMCRIKREALHQPTLGQFILVLGRSRRAEFEAAFQPVEDGPEEVQIRTLRHLGVTTF